MSNRNDPTNTPGGETKKATDLGDVIANMVTVLDSMGKDDYDKRKVDEYEDVTTRVSTATMADGLQPFETGIRHQEYNGNKIVIVEAYDTIEEAKAGQEKWVKLMTSDKLPDSLTDCCNCTMAKWLKEQGYETVFPRVPIISHSE